MCKDKLTQNVAADRVWTGSYIFKPCKQKQICVKFPFYHCILPMDHAWKMQYSKSKNRLRNNIITSCRYVEISCCGMKNILYVFNAWQVRQSIDEKSVMEDRINIMNLTGSLNKQFIELSTKGCQSRHLN